MKLTPYLTAVVSVSCAFGAFAADDSKALLEDEHLYLDTTNKSLFSKINKYIFDNSMNLIIK